MLAGEVPLPMGHLDAMLPLLLNMTTEVPFYAATVARARVKKMHERLAAALSGAAAAPGSTARESPWPTARTVLQTKLFASLFPTSDKRHPVMTPLGLLLGKILNQVGGWKGCTGLGSVWEGFGRQVVWVFAVDLEVQLILRCIWVGWCKVVHMHMGYGGQGGRVQCLTGAGMVMSRSAYWRSSHQDN